MKIRERDEARTLRRERQRVWCNLFADHEPRIGEGEDFWLRTAPLLLGMTVVLTLVVIAANLLVDLALAAIDPRTRD